MNLNPNQLAAVESRSDWNFVDAGPGSGKTKVIVQRALWSLTHEHSSQNEMAFVTFTAIGAKILRERLEALGIRPAFVGTLHAMILKLMRGLKIHRTLISEADALEFLARQAKTFNYRGSQEALLAALRTPDDGKLTPGNRVAREYRRWLAAEELIDYDTILHLGLAIVEKHGIPWSDLYVDEFQDSGPFDARIYLAAKVRRLFVVADKCQCQPAGTMVLMSDGKTRKPIEQLVVGDGVMGFPRHDKILVRNGRVAATASRHYDGWLYTVSAGGKSTRCTSDHKFIVRWLTGEQRKTDKWCTYIMRSGDRFRVGKTKLFKYTNGAGVSYPLGIVSRVRQEKADCAWVLKIHETNDEAIAYEQIVSATYGLPEACFVESNNKCCFTQNVIDQIYAGVPDQLAKASRCLGDHGRDIEYPLIDKRAKRTRRTVEEIRACNLLDDVMHVPVVAGDVAATGTGYSNNEWMPIKLKRERWSGDVYSLNITPHHTYVADGIVTCNCIFQFRGARPQNVDDYIASGKFAVHTLAANYRCASEICGVANGVIGIPGRTLSATEDDGVVESSTSESGDDELVQVAKQVSGRIAAGTAPSQIAVLCRTNALVAAARDKLISRGIPVAEVESDKKPKDWHLLTLIITQIANPESWANARLLEREMAVIQKRDVGTAESSLEERRKAGGLPYQSYFPPWSVIKSLNANFKRYGVSKASHELLAAKVRLYNPESIDELLEAMRESPEAVYVKGVSVTTVHGAKGAEFDAVCIPGADLFVSDNMDEERRLFFVAVTRARRWLYVSTAAWRSITLPNKRVVTTEREPGEMFNVVDKLAEHVTA